MKSTNLKLIKSTVMRPVAATGRKLNKAYRTREHLTESEVTELLAALKANRHGHQAEAWRPRVAIRNHLV